MPRLALTPALLLALPAAFAVEPVPGASRADVESELGRPTASRSTPAGEIAVYPRGTVTYRDGRVAELKLIPAEIWKKQLEAERLAAEESRLKAEKLAAEQAALVAETAKARTALIESREFAQLSPETRIARLDALTARYPLADVAALRGDLVRTVAAEKETKRREETAAAAAKESERRIRELTAALADTRSQLAEAGVRLIAAEKSLARANADIVNLTGRIASLENLSGARTLSPGYDAGRVSGSPGSDVPSLPKH